MQALLNHSLCPADLFALVCSCGSFRSIALCEDDLKFIVVSANAFGALKSKFQDLNCTILVTELSCCLCVLGCFQGHLNVAGKQCHIKGFKTQNMHSLGWYWWSRAGFAVQKGQCLLTMHCWMLAYETDLVFFLFSSSPLQSVCHWECMLLYLKCSSLLTTQSILCVVTHNTLLASHVCTAQQT